MGNKIVKVLKNMGEYTKNLDMMKASLGQKIQSEQLEIQMPIGSKQC